MSTRALYTFKANPHADHEMDWNVYKHHDGYPTGAADAITAALAYAWKLPRYESDEFAASFIAANKPQPKPEYPGMQGGGVRLMPQGKPLDVAGKHCSDIEYRYEIYLKCEMKALGTHVAVHGEPIGLYVRGYDINIAWGDDTTPTTDRLLFDVPIAKLKAKAKALEKADA